jgi:hypothetical protein
MTESCILFAAISTGSGARNLWLADGGLAGARPGLVNGIAMPVAAPAFDAHDALSPAFRAGGGAANGIQLLASLDWLSAGNAGFAASFLAATLEDSRAFAVPAGPLNTVLSGDLNAFPQPGPFFAFGTLACGLADRDWNSVKNLELSLDSADLAGLEQITLRNIVDVRVKLGDTAAPPPREEGAFDRFISLDVQNAKRGSVDASESEFNESLTLATASNGRVGQNSFDLVLSAFDDLVLLMAADQAGRTFQNFRLVNDGSPSLGTTDLGAGDDTLIAFSGIAFSGIAFSGIAVSGRARHVPLCRRRRRGQRARLQQGVRHRRHRAQPSGRDAAAGGEGQHADPVRQPARPGPRQHRLYPRHFRAGRGAGGRGPGLDRLIQPPGPPGPGMRVCALGPPPAGAMPGTRACCHPGRVELATVLLD